MLAIFDVDGTICDTQVVERECFDRAIKDVTGTSLETTDWNKHVEPTSTAIVRNLLANDPDVQAKEDKIKHLFVSFLEEERPKSPGDFMPLPGAVTFIDRLRNEGFCTIAIASGGFDIEAAYKLNCCGISLHDYPHATSSDTPRRKDFISLSASRAGFELSSVVYFGDAPWDVKVCLENNIKMVGIGRRISQLRELGIKYTFRDYSDADEIIDVLLEFKETGTL